MWRSVRQRRRARHANLGRTIIPEEKLSRRDFLAGIGATLGLAAVGVIAATPMTAVAAKPSGLPAKAACSRCHVSEPCDDDCATCPANQSATLADK